MSRNTEHIFLVIKYLVCIYYIQTLASAITVSPDATTEKISKELLNEFENYENNLQKDLHPFLIKREISKKDWEYSDEKTAPYYHNIPTIQATESDGVVVVATARIEGEEKKYTYDNQGYVTANTLIIKDITSRTLFGGYGAVTGTKYTITAVNTDGRTEVDTLTITSASSTYTHYQDGTYISPTKSSTSLPVYTRTKIYEAFGTLTTVYYTVYDLQNSTDSLAYSTYTTTDPSGNIVTNTVTTMQVTITEDNIDTTTLLTITGLTTYFSGLPTVVTSVNEVTVSTDKTGGTVTKTISPAVKPTVTSVQTITTTDNNGNTITTTTTVTGQGPVTFPETTTITDSTKITKALVEAPCTSTCSPFQSIVPTSTMGSIYSTTFDTTTVIVTDGSSVIVDSSGNTVKTVIIVEDDETSTVTLTATTVSGDNTMTASELYVSGSFSLDIDISGSIFPVISTESLSLTTTDSAGSTTVQTEPIDSNDDSIITTTIVQDGTTSTIILTAQDTTLVTTVSGDSTIIETDTIVTSGTISEVMNSDGSMISSSSAETNINTIPSSTTQSNEETTTSSILINSSDTTEEVVVTISGITTTETVKISASVVTDSSGSTVTDANGDPVTEIVTEYITKPTTDENENENTESGDDTGSQLSSTETTVTVTDSSGNPVIDSNGNPVTQTTITVTDSSGSIVTDTNGKPVTEVVTGPQLSSTETTVVVTDSSGNPVTDSNGNPVTQTTITVTDSSGSIVTDTNGKPVTEVVTGPQLSSTETTVVVTDSSGNPVTDSNGNPVTQTTITVTDSSGSIVTDTNGKPVTEVVTGPQLSSTETTVVVTDSSGNPVTDSNGNPVTQTTITVTDSSGSIVTDTNGKPVTEVVTGPQLSSTETTVVVTDSSGNPVTDSNGNPVTQTTITVTDSSGSIVTDTNGKPVTEVVTGPQLSSTETTVVVTDSSGNPVTDSNGNPVTQTTITVTDSSGSIVTDTNGNPVTEVVTGPQLSSTETTVVVTDSSGNPVTDSNGNPVTQTTITVTDSSGSIVTDTNGKPVTEVVNGPQLSSTETTVTVTDSSGNPVIDSNGNPVTQTTITVTDSSGSIVTDTNGNPVTEVVTGPQLSSTETTVTVTDSSGNPVTDSNGNPVTQTTITVTDSSGSIVTDTNGKPVTEVVTGPQLSSTETTVVVTDSSGNPVTDSNGNPVTQTTITVTDSSGSIVTDTNGKPVTEVVTGPQLSSTETTVVVTDSSGNPVTDSNGNPVTQTTITVTDSSGSIVTDTNGKPVTEVVTGPQLSSTETTVVVTDSSGNPVTDSNGNPVTQTTITVTDSSGSIVTDTNGNPVTEVVTGPQLSSTETTVVVTDSSGNPITDSNGNPVTQTTITVTDSSGSIVTDTNGKPVTEVVTGPQLSSTETTVVVTDSSGNPVTDSNGNPVTQTTITVTDSSGSIVTDTNGNPVTEVVTGPQLSSTETTVVVTDSSGNPVTDSNGNPVTQTTITVTDSSGSIVTDTNGKPVTEVVTGPQLSSTETTVTVTDSSGNPVIDSNGNVVTEISVNGSSPGSESSSSSISIQATLDSNETITDYNETSYIYSFQENFILDLPSYGNKKCPFNKVKPFVQQLITEVESVGVALLWDAKQDGLLLTDKHAKQISKLNPNSGKWVHVYLAAKQLDAIIPTTDPLVYVVIADKRIVHVETSFTEDETIVNYKKLFATFDSSIGFTARTDPAARLWLSVRYIEKNIEKENLYMLCNGTASIQETIIERTGGMAWSPDKQHFYISDLKLRIIYVYDYNNSTGSIQNRQILIDFKQHPEFIGTPYDIAVDSTGGLWIAMFGNREVIKFNCVTMEVEKIIVIPQPYPVSLAFGESELDSIFVTTAFNKDPLNFPLVYAIGNTGVKGYNPTHAISPDHVFGSTPMKITIDGADPEPVASSSPYKVIPLIGCSIPIDRMKYTTVANGACAFSQESPIVQVAETLITSGALSAHYDKKKDVIFMADVFKPALIKWKQSTSEAVTLTFTDVSSTTTVIRIKGESEDFIVAEDNRIVMLRNSFKHSENVSRSHKSIIAKLQDSDANLIFSVGKTDSKGRLWIGTRHIVTAERKSCKLYLLTKRTLKEMDSGYTTVGGMAWSIDKTCLYVADDTEGIIYKYKYTEATGKIYERMEVFSVKGTAYEKYHINDIVVDSQDHIWAAISGGRMVIQMTKFGEIKREIAIPGMFPSTLEFGGDNRDQLFVGTKRAGHAKCSINNGANLYVITNLGVSAGRKTTDNFVL